jgi:hypothetical protein
LLLLGHKSFWLDEAFSVELARQAWPEFRRVLAEREANSALYFLLLRLWLPLGDGEATVRALSVIPAVATIPVLYALGRQLFGVRVGLLAALLLAVNGSHIRYAQEARGYSLAVFLATLATLLFARLVRRPSSGVWLGYVLSAVLAVYSHFFAGLVLIAHAASLAFLPRQDLPRRSLLGAGASVGVLLLPLGMFLARTDAGQIAWVKPPSGWEVLQVLWALAGIGSEVAVYLVLAGVALGAGAAAWRARGRSFEVWRYALPALWLVLPLIAALAVSVAKPVLVDRYLLVSLPAFVLLAAVGLERLPAGWAGRRLGLAGVLVLAVSGVLLYHVAFKKEDWRGTTGFLLAEGRPGDAVIFYPPYVRRPFDYYAARLVEHRAPGGETRRSAGDVVFPSESYAELVPDSALVAGLPERYSRVRVVLSHVGSSGSDRDVVGRLDADLTRAFGPPDTTRFQEIKVLLYGRGQ